MNTDAPSESRRLRNKVVKKSKAGSAHGLLRKLTGQTRRAFTMHP